MRYVVAMVCTCHMRILGQGEPTDLFDAVFWARELRHRLAGDSGCWIVVRPAAEPTI